MDGRPWPGSLARAAERAVSMEGGFAEPRFPQPLPFHLPYAWVVKANLNSRVLNFFQTSSKATRQCRYHVSCIAVIKHHTHSLTHTRQPENKNTEMQQHIKRSSATHAQAAAHDCCRQTSTDDGALLDQAAEIATA